MDDLSIQLLVLVQQCINGLSNGMIISLIAIGYTLVYGIVELINFAHGDLVMLGCFFAMTILGLAGIQPDQSTATISIMLLGTTVVTAMFCGGVNFLVDRWAYRPLRGASRLAQLVTAIGVSFVFLNFGLFWGGVPLEIFGFGRAAAAQKDVPLLVSQDNILGDAFLQLTYKDVLVILITVPLLLVVRYLVRSTKWGVAMRAVAQNPTAAKLMGINVDRVIGWTFFLGGALGGISGVVYAFYNDTIYYQMGFRIGMDGFTAAVLGGIGNLSGAVLGGLVIGIIRAMSDQYVATQWTNVVVFSVLILVLVFRPAGLLGAQVREKV